MECQQKYSNSCCLISLDSVLTVSGEVVATRSIVLQIDLSLNFQYPGYHDRIKMSNSIMIDNEWNKV